MNDKKNPHRYDDMLDLARPVSRKHTPMSVENRAAQFAPFAALTGYTEAVQVTAEGFQYDEGISYSREE